jgi:hypothetical protein
LTPEDRVNEVAKFGFTERQARFLITVMLHGGVCVPRQYARFVGTAYGRRVNLFFDKLVRLGLVTVGDCVHNRARLYHVRHRSLYRAIGEPESRCRHPVPAAGAIERVMLLDGLVTQPELIWLGTEQDKVSFFGAMAPTLSEERLPHVTVGMGSRRRVRFFPERLPIGIETSGRVVFLYLVTKPIEDDFRAFLQRHGDLLRALPGWTLRFLVPPYAAAARTRFEEAARDELTACFRPALIDDLKWYFHQRQVPPEDRLSLSDLEHSWTAREAFDTPRCRVLYRRWLADGDTALEIVSSPAIAEALARGTGRIESQVLEVPYRHLSPLLKHVHSSSKGVEEGEQRGEPTSAHPQPPSIDSSVDQIDSLSA